MTSHEQLDAAVKSAFKIRPNPKRLWIFSISTINIQPYLMNATDTKIAEVNLLLANAETYIQQPHRDFLEESKLTILWNWVTSVKSGKVERLTLRQFNFYPTEWFVVLDEEVVIFGHYYYDEENIARAKSTETKFVVRNIPGSGDNLVRSYIKKFDELFNECETNFGVNWGVITSVDTNLTAGHWPSSI